MSCVVRALTPIILVLAAVAPAQGEPTLCALGEGPTSAMQDDAGSGADAGDDLSLALWLESVGHWNGGLELPTPSGPGDQADAYTVEIGAGADRVMVSLASYSTPVQVGSDLIVVDVIPPGETAPVASVPLGAPQHAFEPIRGTWSFRVRFVTADGAGCAETPLPVGAPPQVSALLRTYTFYVGCDPVCV